MDQQTLKGSAEANAAEKLKPRTSASFVKKDVREKAAGKFSMKNLQRFGYKAYWDREHSGINLFKLLAQQRIADATQTIVNRR